MLLWKGRDGWRASIEMISKWPPVIPKSRIQQSWTLSLLGIGLRNTFDIASAQLAAAVPIRRTVVHD